MREAVKEIKAVSRRDRALAGEGAVLFLQRVSAAIEHVDSSSGAMGTAVTRAIEELVPIIAGAPIEPRLRDAWLERLWVAHENDQIPYIESLGDHWGELCGSEGVASAWADRLVDVTRMALSPDPSLHGFFHGTSACLSALYTAERYEEIVEIVAHDTIWPYKEWAVKALVAMGRRSEALRYAESCRSPWASDAAIDAICEEILLCSGLIEEAYRRYGLRVRSGGTYLAAFRALTRKYPDKGPRQLLADLVETTPGSEAKWFAAAKEAGLYEEALALAGSGPCDPRTLTRACRNFAAKEPAFALEAGLLALGWLATGYGYEVSGADALAAYSAVKEAAVNCGRSVEAAERMTEIVRMEGPGGLVGSAISRLLGVA